MPPDREVESRVTISTPTTTPVKMSPVAPALTTSGKVSPLMV
jgi:hypothetical protein